ncbi:alpha-hydroxy acid oxidase [Labrys monachus]|uniref:L-lactate dehydrogenase (Cytochrome)/(S)-mandelate dehydrogenase n=1 Tax=Labrys monachus TaxID=217067 RepID=A0ABU0F9Z7_9HYPH|nr:alpha-hydroxy acid oxidase [Labrys monachus]MDQ0391436.1 L-lactate dehydrogenase (cytochrome)/(S)-mandelate dehydrogenase [Labrys monachus]
MPALDLNRRGYSIDAMRLLARGVLPRFAFDFADGGAEDEWTLRRNEAAFDDFAIVPKPLNGAGERDLSISLFGRRISMPLLVGPTGLAGLFWPRGEECVARAAAAAGTGFCLSHGSVCTLEDVAGVGASPRWMQVFIYRDKEFTRELTQRAQQANYDALVLTIDNQHLGKRERDIRNGFGIPPRFGPVALAEMSLKTGWFWRMRTELPRITFGNYVRPGETSDMKTLAGRMASLLDPAMSWTDVDALRALWRGPLILKGILHPDEAREAVERGVDGIIVSNHGGRQLDGAPGSLDMLPAVAQAVDGRIPVFLDGGVRRGADIVKAIALGATACLIGRPQLWGLAVAGERGMAHVLDIYRREMDRVMGLAGLRSVDEIGPDLLNPPAGPSARSFPPRTFIK